MSSAPFSGANEGDQITALSLLTRRERQVAGLIALGHTNSEVGHLLHIHEKTVETHRNHLMTKLGLRTRADLVRFALAQGLVSSGPTGQFLQRCSGCSMQWQVRNRFLSDREVVFVGYEPAEAPYSPGAMAFHHRPCGAKLSVALETFTDLAGEPLLAASCPQDGKAPEYCLAKTPEHWRPHKCLCAFVWRASQIINQGWKR